VIDAMLLRIFVWISKRWFGSVIFATDPDTERVTSMFFFDMEDHAHRFMEIIQKEKLNHELEKEQKNDH
jgi:hypothetical protein